MANLKSPTTADGILSNAERQYKALKTNMVTRSADFANGGTGRDVLSLVSFLKSITGPLQLAIDTAGANDAAKLKYSDNTYAVSTDLTELIKKVNSTITEIVGLIPVNGGGYMLLMTMNADNVPVWRTFTGPQLAPLIAKIDEIIAVID
ncbi:MAG: hypothetical protein JKY53_00260 [Flavobacteriales bacterium]|nr:hypothetical protein [Flavobacteriales bacterium]